MQIAFTAEELAAMVQPQSQRGGTSAEIRGLAALSHAQPGDLSFLGNAKYKADVATTAASVVLVPPDYEGQPKPDQLYLVVSNPSVALAQVCARIEQSLWPKPKPGIHPSAVVAPEARVAASATVGPLCVVEAGAVIGERVHLQAQVFVGRDVEVAADAWLMPGVTVATDCRIGERVRLQPGVIIGSDGFGYEFVDGRHVKVPQVGNVVIEADVEIGANSTIDRARFSHTIIGEGTKIDNLVQIGHNVRIGQHCILCALVGIAGSTTLEDYVVFGGQAGAAGHITIGRGSRIGGRGGVTGDAPAGSNLMGTPAIPYLLERRLTVLHRRLPELFRQVETLMETVDDLKKASAA
jgi:UDP-3-O-[3-hydroxymyristoyl] glucosamine N-acyltransferase